MADFYEIDICALDDEWLRQPKMYHKWAKKKAEAKKALDQAKAALDVAKARVARDVRKHPDKHGVERVTNDSVTEAVTISDRVQKATDDVAEAGYQYDIMAAAVSTLEHRKRALSELVELHGRDYFSDTPTKRLSDAARAGLEHKKKKKRRKRGMRGKDD